LSFVFVNSFVYSALAPFVAFVILAITFFPPLLHMHEQAVPPLTGAILIVLDAIASLAFAFSPVIIIVI
jgi:hypothetical protein